ncbi:hypothetical protein [Ottowia sp.]|uniref:hypothetical protein n=1 Tax=Ottowia sp. TaxID=1898956 RepID=UPI002C42C4EE|nr:hypothetical protein [Ottowia sp.]HNR84664.1 hypothetical protein [Ottowia sp.]HNU05814.1 hypothetical protein [Anaerolineae bacterium]
MERVFGLAALAVIGGAVAVLALGWRVLDRVGDARIYADLTRWALVLTVIVGGIVFTRVLLNGLAKLSMGRNAHKAQLVERERIIERHTIDGRLPGPAPQIVTIDRPQDLRQIYPDAMRAAIESGRPAGQIAAPDAYPVELPTADVWAQLETLFQD